jgi:hypothetical protein
MLTITLHALLERVVNQKVRVSLRKLRSAQYQALVAGRSGGAPEHTQGYALTGDLAFARLKSPLPSAMQSVGLLMRWSRHMRRTNLLQVVEAHKASAALLANMDSVAIRCSPLYLPADFAGTAKTGLPAERPHLAGDVEP